MDPNLRRAIEAVFDSCETRPDVQECVALFDVCAVAWM